MNYLDPLSKEEQKVRDQKIDDLIFNYVDQIRYPLNDLLEDVYNAGYNQGLKYCLELKAKSKTKE